MDNLGVEFFFSNKHSGAVELVIDPSNPRILYASTWRVNRTPYSFNSGGKGSALWKSVDQGKTWKKISTNKGFAVGVLGIIGVTVSPVNPQKFGQLLKMKLAVEFTAPMTVGYLGLILTLVGHLGNVHGIIQKFMQTHKMRILYML